MKMNQLLEANREQILSIAAKHGARNVRVFGSAARGEADEASDVDLLVELAPGRSLLDQAALVVELSSALAPSAPAQIARRAAKQANLTFM